MTQGGTRKQPESNKKIDVDPRAQAALDELIEKNRQKRTYKKLLKRFLFILILLMMPPLLLNFYCCYVVGTHYEKITLKEYPLSTRKIVHATVTLDDWYMKAMEPVINAVGNREDNAFRRTVTDLGLEVTRNGAQDEEKIQSLRSAVAEGFVKKPQLIGRSVAFAVYELPPKKPDVNN